MAKQKETKDTDLSMQLEHFVSSGKIKKAKLKYDVGDRNGCILAAARLASESGEDYYVFATGLRWKATPTSVGTSKNTIKAQGGLRITPKGEVFIIEHPFKSQASTETTALSIPKPKGDWNTGADSHWLNYRTILQNYAKKFGYRELGSGCSGFVLYRVQDPFFLIKVFIDRAYKAYVDLCQTKLKGNPYVPVFKGKPVIIVKKPVVYAIRIEHLNALLEYSKSKTLLNGDLVKQTRNLLEYFRHRPEDNAVDLNNLVVEYLTKNNMSIFELYNTDKYYKQFILEMIPLIANKRYDIDIYPDNVMQRGKQIVFIDPIWG